MSQAKRLPEAEARKMLHLTEFFFNGKDFIYTAHSIDTRCMVKAAMQQIGSLKGLDEKEFQLLIERFCFT